MIKVGYRPILWHIMKYYAHFGHRDFILCLGYKADVIKNYFLNYNECISNDFVLTEGGGKLELLQTDVQDWRITFVDTGMEACIGERLCAVQPYLENEDYFLANYADCVTDYNLNEMIARFQAAPEQVACFLSTPPNYSFHIIHSDDDGSVCEIEPARSANMWINGGFFVLHKDIFDYMKPGEDLVDEPFRRLIDERRLMNVQHKGFWACMDTFKEQRSLDQLYSRGEARWAVWDAGQQTPVDSPQGAASRTKLVE